MIERRHFDTIDPSLRNIGSIDLDLGERVEIPFTGAEIIYAATISGDRVVIKKHLNNDRAKHEWEGLNIAESTGISIPKPIALISYTADQLAIVSSYVNGDKLYDNPNLNVKVEVGKQIKKMHQNAQIAGKDWVSSGRSLFLYYDRYIFRWAEGDIVELNADSRTASMLGELTDAAVQFCNNSEPTFNHNDLHDGQVIVEGNGKPTIIDFGNWIEETWLNDIGYHLFHLIRIDRADTDDFTKFLSGYMENKKLPDTEKTNLAFYLLFISSRALNYFYRRHSSYLPVAQETHKKVLAHLENESIWKDY
ncbi:MAG TPA: phosphotransferase [Clostridia bacterium]|nr:phosphotransferase [Clostridia bacterium]